MVDLLVIGAGIASLSAALNGANAGLSVRVIAKGMGALHWSAGTIDLLGYHPGTGETVHNPLKAITALPDEHPYRRAGSEALANAIATFQETVAAAGLPYTGSAQEDANLWLPSPVGAARPTYLVPLAQIGGDLARTEPLLIVGFGGMRDFYPQLIAQNLNKLGHTARAASLPLELLTPRVDSNTVQLAKSLENPTRLDALAERLQSIIRQDERIGLPAILGLENHRQALARLQQITGATVFEIPTLPPSVPGIRLYRALSRRLMALGGRIDVGMEASGHRAELHSHGKIIHWVETESSARPMRHWAENYLLATGGILGGGFQSDHQGRVWEGVFDLPVDIPPERPQWFRPTFLDPNGHPIFQGGVQVDAQLQPVGEDGAPLFANLWAVGNLLAHTDSIQERSLEGIALASSSAAVRSILSRISTKSCKQTG